MHTSIYHHKHHTLFSKYDIWSEEPLPVPTCTQPSTEMDMDLSFIPLKKKKTIVTQPATHGIDRIGE